MKTIEIKTNKSKNRVALVQMSNGGYKVLIEKTNYSCGRNITKWFTAQVSRKMTHNEFQNYASNGICFDEAKKLFNKKAA